MNRIENQKPAQLLDRLELLQAARGSSLRQANIFDLRKLITRLELACEATRIAAIRRIREPTRQVEQVGDVDQDCGFADFLAALRLARAEIKRRDRARSQATIAELRKKRGSVLVRGAVRGPAMFVQPRGTP